MPIGTRRMLLAGAAGTLALALSGNAAAQDTSNSAAQTSSQPQTAQAEDSAQPGQPMSLGDLARLARAKKQSEPKAGKVIDDDNLPRSGAGISIVGNAPGDSSAHSRGRGSSVARGGKVVLLDFAASWCGPCRESLPDLKQLQSAYGRDQLEVISIGEDKNENAWHNFVEQNQINWSQRFDSGGEMSRQYGVNAFPTFILTDERGTVLQRFVGEDPNTSLANRIAPYVNKSSQGAL